MGSGEEKPIYTISKSSDALGITHKVHGPGMPQYANELHFIQPLNEWATKCMAVDALAKEDREERTPIWDHNAERMLGFLQAAFEAGRQDMRRELRELLGIRGG